MGYFEFLHNWRIICLPLNIPEKLHWQQLFEKPKRQRLIAFILVSTIQYPRTMKNNIYYSNKREPPPFFLWDTNSVLGHVLIHSVDSTLVLVATVELIWLLFLNILSSNFVPTSNKSLLGWQNSEELRKPPCSCPNQPHKLNYFSVWCALRCLKWPLSLLIAAVCPQW